MVPHQEAPVLAVLALEAPVDFEWLLAGQPLAALIPQSSPILGMEESRVAPGVRGHQLFHGESREFEQRPVRVKGCSVWAEDDNGLGNGVDDAPQLLLVLAQLRFSSLEVFYIRIRSVPPEDVASFVAERLDPDHEPPILAVAAPQSHLELTRLPSPTDLLPPLARPRSVVRMHYDRANVAHRAFSFRLPLPPPPTP